MSDRKTRKRSVFGRRRVEVGGKMYLFEMGCSGVTFKLCKKHNAPETVLDFNRLVDFTRNTFQHTIDGRFFEFQIIGGKIHVLPVSTPEIESEAAIAIYDDSVNQMKLL